jgi:hypothetical protein
VTADLAAAHEAALEQSPPGAAHLGLVRLEQLPQLSAPDVRGGLECLQEGVRLGAFRDRGQRGLRREPLERPMGYGDHARQPAEQPLALRPRLGFGGERAAARVA